MGNAPTTKKDTHLTDNRKNSHPLLVKSEPHDTFVIFLVYVLRQLLKCVTTVGHKHCKGDDCYHFFLCLIMFTTEFYGLDNPPKL